MYTFPFFRNLVSLFFLALMLFGCKLTVVVTSGGDVSSSSLTRDCLGGSLCEFDITASDLPLSESFTVTERPGYRFAKWHGGEGFLCADSTNRTCLVTIEDNDFGSAIVAWFGVGYLMPIFDDVGFDTDKDGVFDRVDQDDDNDGVLDFDDQCPLQGPNIDGYGCPKNASATPVLVIDSSSGTNIVTGIKNISFVATNGTTKAYNVEFRVGSYNEIFGYDMGSPRLPTFWGNEPDAIKARDALGEAFLEDGRYTSDLLVINGCPGPRSPCDIGTPYGDYFGSTSFSKANVRIQIDVYPPPADQVHKHSSFGTKSINYFELSTAVYKEIP